MIIKGSVLFKLLLFTSVNVYASSKIQNFEGSINLKKETAYDTSYLTIKVKGELVRIDEINKNRNLVNSYIVDLEKETVIALSPQKHLYREIKSTTNYAVVQKDTQIISTGNCMEYGGYKCCQVRVKCVNRDSEVAYWITKENFNFFNLLVRVLRKTNVNINVFNYFPDIEGGFPVLTVERTLMRKERLKIAVAAIEPMNLSDNNFKIPLDYQKLEH